MRTIRACGEMGDGMSNNAITKRLDFTEDQKKIIRDTFANGATEAELAPLLEIAAQRRLNPFARQVYFVKRYDNLKKAHVWAVQVSIDGLRAIAERTGKYAGQDEPEYIENASDDWRSRNGNAPMCCKVRVFRDGWVRPVVGVAYWEEFVQKTHEGHITAFWRRMPRIMLAKCAEALALRKAFPEDTSGLYIPEEMGAGVVQQGELVEEELETKRITAPKQTLRPAEPKPASSEVVDSVTGEVTTPQVVSQATAAKSEAIPISELVPKMVELRKLLDETPKPRLYAMVDFWIKQKLSEQGQIGQSPFWEIMSRLPAKMPKAWFLTAIPIACAYAKQEPTPEKPGDSYEPSERSRFEFYLDCIEQAVDTQAIAQIWESRKMGATKETALYWWHCAVVEVAISNSIDCEQADKRLKEEVAKLNPQPPPEQPKKRGRKAPVSTPANGQGHETTTPDAPQSLAEWELHLERKQNPSIQELERSLAKRLREWTPEQSEEGIQAFMEYLITHGATQAKILAMVKTARDLANRQPVQRAA